ncbi:MAG TPA: MIP/aquaporin family protein [Gammaproteobacteria bacterium]
MKPLQPLFAEFLGTAFLLAVIVGSGIMAQRLAGGNEAIALLANSLATGAGLVAIILMFGPVSGAHLNPLVSLLFAARGELAWVLVPGYVMAQFAGAIVGVLAIHAMFAMPLLEVAAKPRPGVALMWSEFVATAGLLLLIHRSTRSQAQATPYAVGLYIMAAYWFTSSTSFANPAVTLARSVTDSYTGIRPIDVPGFLAAQVLAGMAIIVSLVLAERRQASKDGPLTGRL